MAAQNILELIESFIFLSYAKEDKVKVSQIYNRLKNDNLKPWIDDHYLFPGSDWDRVIRKAIRKCRFFAVFLSSNSVNKRGYIQKEISVALDVAEELPEGEIFIIPVRLKDCEVPERLRKWQWVDIFRRGGYNKLKNILIHQLGDNYQQPSPKRSCGFAIPRASFKKAEDYTLFEHFINRDTFIYAVLGRRKYGLSDGRILIIRKDLPKDFLKLMQCVSTARKMSSKSMLGLIPPRKIYYKTKKELKFIEPVETHLFMLHPRKETFLVKVNSLYWRFVDLYCDDPKTYLISPSDPIVIEDYNEPKMLIMPMR